MMSSNVPFDTMAASELVYGRPNAFEGSLGIQDVRTFTSLDFYDESEIGGGGFGRVFRRSVRGGNVAFVAEKRITNNLPLKEEAKEGLRQEASILASTRHPNIVELLGVLIEEDRFSLILEYLPNRCCRSFFSKVPNVIEVDEKWPFKFRVAVQVCDAMEYLHRKRILHRDLKSRNVLLDDKLNAKICDFGLSQFKNLSQLTRTSAELIASSSNPSNRPKVAGGTISHFAPEHLQHLHQPHSNKSDVYSFGIFLWELLTEAEPYANALNCNELKDHVIRGTRPDKNLIPKSAPKKLKSCMTDAWDADPHQRPEFKDMLDDLKGEPVLFPDDVIAKCVDTILQHIKFVSGLTKSDSHLMMSPPGRPPVRGITKSDGNSCGRRMLVQGQTTLVKMPIQEETTAVKMPVPVTRSSGFKPISEHQSRFFHTQPLSTDPSEAPLISGVSTSISSTDILISREPPSSIDQRCGCCKSRRSKFAFCAIFFLVVIFCAFFFLFCFIHGGCFGSSCAPLKNEAHQKINCTSSGGNILFGTKCVVSCDPGYGIRTGDSQLTCQRNGKWSSNLPACSLLKECSSLPPPANSGSISCSDSFYEMSVCHFSCSPGYRLHPSAESPSSFATSTCEWKSEDPQAIWSSPEPYCEEADTCPPLPHPPAGHYLCTDQQSKVVDDVTNGTACDLNCNEHFEVRGSSSRVCLKGGVWDNKNPPVCERVCPAIGGFDGNYSCTQQHFVNSVCTFHCKKNFVMLGPVRTTCLASGGWSYKPPECVCPACRMGANCDQPRTWNDTLARMKQSYSSGETFYYGNHPIKCYKKEDRFNVTRGHSPLVMSRDSTSSCVCRDVPSNNMKQCNGLATLEEVCRNSLSSLMLLMTYKGQYLLPCDAYAMPPTCTK